MFTKLKKFITATNILIAVLILLYFLDRFLPFPEGYDGFNMWDEDSSAAFNYIFGNCGGLLTNYMALGSSLSPSGTSFYRHLTSMLLHGHILHLIANVVGLYFIGNYAEKRFGWWLTYLVFIIVGSTEGYITDPLYFVIAPDKKEATLLMPSLGASGGIFGVIGFTLAAVFFDVKSFKQIDKTTIIVSAIYGFLTTWVVSLGWTTVCHNVSMVLGLAIGTALILPFFLLKKGKFGAAPKENMTEGDFGE